MVIIKKTTNDKYIVKDVEKEVVVHKEGMETGIAILESEYMGAP